MKIAKISSSALKVLTLSVSLLGSLPVAHAQTGGKQGSPTNLELVERSLARASSDPRLVRVGDMLLSREALQDYRDQLKKQGSGGLGTNIAFGFKVNLWPGGRVPYVFDADCPEDAKAVFLSAAREWEKWANLKFTPRTSETDYIHVFRDPTAIGFSYSALGRVGGPQDLSLSEGSNTFLACHELAHALGCEHEHQRSDRDQYITVNFANVTADSQDQFTILTNSDNLSTYDFDSIMHYFANAFAIDPSQPTMICKPGYEQFQDTMGQQDHISELDKKGMEKKYPFPAAPTLSVNGATVFEGATKDNKAVFTISLSAASTKATTVSYTTINGTAKAGSDYTTTSGTVTIAAGDTKATFSVPILNDEIVEGTETFGVTISNASGATIGTANGVGTILDDDGVPTISTSRISVVEGDKSTVKANLTVNLSSPAKKIATVRIATLDGTAIAPDDYKALPTTILAFEPGQTSKTVSFTIAGDFLYEGNESFKVTLSNPVNAILKTKTTEVTIIDNDEPPVISVKGSSIVEGQAEKSPLLFTVTLSNPSTRIVKVRYATIKNALSTATEGVDYIGIPQTELSFAPGETSKTVGVTIKDDTLDEEDETIALRLVGPSNGSILDATSIATGVIKDDDDAPSVSIVNASIGEGNTGSHNIEFPITLSTPSAKTVTVAYLTSDVTAKAGSDYVGVTKSQVIFAPGETEKTIGVAIKGDTVIEDDETFALRLTAVTNGQLGGKTAIGTIRNDDSNTPTLSVNSPAVTEGDEGFKSLPFSIKLSKASTTPVTVSYFTADGSAKAGQDYRALEKTLLTFAPGETSKTVVVKVNGDTISEATESFNLVLSAPKNANLAETKGEGIIYDNDAAPALVEPSAASS